MFRKLYLLLFAVLIVERLAAQVVYVTPAGAGQQNGSSWANAYSAAMLPSVLRTPPPSGTLAVWLAAGTYKPHATIRDSSFNIAPGIKLYGGFAGTETQLSQRNWVSHPTILSGDIGRQNDTSDNSYHVIRMVLANDVLLDGLTITGGNANHPTDYYKQMGGGILHIGEGTSLSSSAPEIRHCKISANSASWGGGGLMNTSVAGNAIPTIDSCSFENNHTAGKGGAICSKVEYGTAGNCNLNLFHSTFTGNTASGPFFTYGGAISIAAGNESGAVIRQCVFQDNTTTGTGGAIDITGIQTATIDSCRFLHNSAPTGMAINRGSWGELTLSNSLFSDQYAATGTAVVWLSSVSASTRNNIIGCRFLNNNQGRTSTVITSVTSTRSGGINGSDTLMVSNCFFYNNCTGSAIYTRADDNGRHVTFVTNTTVFHDSAFSQMPYSVENSTNTSSIFPQTESSVFVRNCIFWHQLPDWGTTWQFELYNYTSSPYLPASSAHSSVANSVLVGADGTWPVAYGVNGGGNSGLYPRFIDTAAMDFRPGCGSVAFNGGNNTFLYPAGLARDISGTTRILGGTVDMGAFETDPAALLPRKTVSATTNGRMLTYAYNYPADSVRWTFGDGGTATGRNGTHTYMQGGSYNVCLYVRNACGTVDTCFRVTANTAGAATVAGPETALSCYPNPAGSSLSVRGVRPQEWLRIYSLTGSLICRQQAAHPGVLVLSVEQLPAGAYLVELEDEQHMIRRARFVKQ